MVLTEEAYGLVRLQPVTPDLTAPDRPVTGFSRVAVIGLGYVGLPTAAMLANRGLNVIGVDVCPERVEAVNRGEAPFVEPEVGHYIATAVAAQRLRATATPEPADVFIIAVPTPFKDDHVPDLSYIEAAAQAIAPHLKDGDLVILESTSPPKTTAQMAEWILQLRPDLSLDGRDGRAVIDVAHCPERVLPGRVMTELVDNDRIIGGLTPRAAAKARDLYATFCQGQIHLTDAVTAELTKLVENSFRDVNIAFANELSLISHRLGVDVWELIELANHHSRVNILQPGPGVGGHCIAVDPWFIVDAAPEEARLIRTARQVNDDKPRWDVSQVEAAVQGQPAPRIAALGLAYKPDIDDLRESPARLVANQLAEKIPAAEVMVVEPNIDTLPKELADRPNVSLRSLDQALDQADIVVLLVDHKQFRGAVTQRFGAAGRPVIDTRGVLR
jgi:UDP-N-acetyl-D-mannosaminuronic acid dehydrogenase